MSKVVVEKYSTEWPLQFELLKQEYETTLQGIPIDIQHVGSTSVPDMVAKPVIDIDIIINTADLLPKVIERLSAVGYTHVGDLGIAGREAFKYNQVTGGSNKPKHNLYVCLAGCVSLQNHLLLRNYLRANADVANQYSAIKTELASRYADDIDSYIEGKTAFIVDILNKCGMATTYLNEIVAANKAPIK
jgi:GrpB-like predicted nucleotidyltransferase (UPF0157 family)